MVVGMLGSEDNLERTGLYSFWRVTKKESFSWAGSRAL